MIDRISSIDNPNFFLLNYDKSRLGIINFLIIPKHFFTPRVIEKRKPLPHTARRAGWIGCNILLNTIPESGRIFYVKERQVLPKEKVMQQWQKTAFLRRETPESRGWLMDILACIEKIPSREFKLDDVYAFEKELQKLHPENNFVRDKIRQQLQVLRDKGIIQFLARGYYSKL
jgi:type II restriction enzyme